MSYDLTNQTIKSTFSRLLQKASSTDNTLLDGTGSVVSDLWIQGSLSASGDISASGTIFANRFQSNGSSDSIQLNDDLQVSGKGIVTGSLIGLGDTTLGNAGTDKHTITGDITASGAISCSGFVYARQFLTSSVAGTLPVLGSITASADISASGDLYGRSLVIGGGATPNRLTDIFTYGGITGSQAISSSGNIYGNTIQAGGAGTALKTAVLAYGGITGSNDISSSATIIAKSINPRDYIVSRDDDNTLIDFRTADTIIFHAGGEQLLTLTEDSQDIVTIGDGGDVDFQVKSNGDDNAIFVLGSSDDVGIGTNAPVRKLNVKGDISGSGDLTITGKVVNTGSLVTKGSTTLGDNVADTHTFTGHVTASVVSASGELTAQNLVIGKSTGPIRTYTTLVHGGITGSKTISASGNLYGNTIQIGASGYPRSNAVVVNGSVSASQAVTASGNIYGKIVQAGGTGTALKTAVLAYGGITGSQAISASGNIYGSTIQAGGSSTVTKTALLTYGGVTGSNSITMSGGIHGYSLQVGGPTTTNRLTNATIYGAVTASQAITASGNIYGNSITVKDTLSTNYLIASGSGPISQSGIHSSSLFVPPYTKTGIVVSRNHTGEKGGIYFEGVATASRMFWNGVSKLTVSSSNDLDLWALDDINIRSHGGNVRLYSSGSGDIELSSQDNIVLDSRDDITLTTGDGGGDDIKLFAGGSLVLSASVGPTSGDTVIIGNGVTTPEIWPNRALEVRGNTIITGSIKATGAITASANITASGHISTEKGIRARAEKLNANITFNITSSGQTHYIAHASTGTVYDLPAAGACVGCEYKIVTSVARTADFKIDSQATNGFRGFSKIMSGSGRSGTSGGESYVSQSIIKGRYLIYDESEGHGRDGNI